MRPVLPNEKSVLNCPGPVRMLCPALPYPVAFRSEPITGGAHKAAALIHPDRRACTEPAVSISSYVAPGHIVTVETPARPKTPPPFGSVNVIGKPLCAIISPVSDQPLKAAPMIPVARGAGTR